MGPAGAAPGRVLARRYRLVRPLARGGMAEVWEGRDEVLGRAVAVKVLQSHLSGDAVFVERFRREAVTAAAVSSPSIVATYDAGLDDGTAYIVMELVDGRTLRQLLDGSGALDVGLAVEIAAQIADALGRAHRAGLVHRDVKPANVLVCDDEDGGVRAKVTDFGIAKARAGLGADLTQTGTVLGTPKYLSPEQIQGRHEVDERADLYSLGIVLFEMLTGQVPFAGPADMTIALAHLHDPAPRVRSLRPSVPAALDDLVARLLAKTPEERPASASEVRRALLAARPGGIPVELPDSTRVADPTPAAAARGGRRPVAAGPFGPGGGPTGAPWSGTGEPGTADTAADRRAPRWAADGAGAGRTRVEPDRRTGRGARPDRRPGNPATGGRAAQGRTASSRTVSGQAVSGQAVSGRTGTSPSRAAPPRARRRRRFRTTGAAVAAVVVAAFVVGGLLVAGSTPPARRSGSATVAIRGVRVYLDVSGRSPDHPGETHLTFDGNPRTSWWTDAYLGPDKAHFGGLYDGEGLAIHLARSARLQRLTVTSSTRGWAASTYVSTHGVAMSAPLADWGQVVSTRHNLQGSASFDLRGRSGDWVLLWLTDLGPAGLANVAELQIRASA